MEATQNIAPIRAALYQKIGGFIKGICHPKEEGVRIAEAEIEWVRMDAPYPLDEQGNPTQSHVAFVEKVRRYAEQGLRAILISPYPETYIEHIETLYRLVEKPVILMEFGFSSRGGNIRRDGAEVREYLARLGYRDENELLAFPKRFVEHLPPDLKRSVERCAEEDRPTAIFNCFPHLLQSWIAEEVFPHTEQGQAKFYEILLPMLLNTPCLAGAVLYCWRDSDSCFSCKAPDCPCETAWGISRLDGSLKPAYAAIQSIYRTQ